MLVVYSSKGGHTRQLAEAVAKGADLVHEVDVKLLAVDKAKVDDVLAADAIIVGTPVYNANVAPAMVQFINQWPYKGQPLRDKVGAAFVSAGGISMGQEHVLTQLLNSMLVFNMIVVGAGDASAPFGAAAITGEPPFNTGLLDERAKEKGQALGYRVANLAKQLKQ